MTRTRHLLATLNDRRAARRYDRAAGRAVNALWAMADLEEHWHNGAAVARLETAATIAADLADEVERTIGGRK